jgi:hypothetical protein
VVSELLAILPKPLSFQVVVSGATLNLVVGKREKRRIERKERRTSTKRREKSSALNS